MRTTGCGDHFVLLGEKHICYQEENGHCVCLCGQTVVTVRFCRELRQKTIRDHAFAARTWQSHYTKGSSK